MPARRAAFPPAPIPSPFRRALLSVSDKTRPHRRRPRAAAAGVDCLTGAPARRSPTPAWPGGHPPIHRFPEMMDGGETLHPVVHGGLLGVRDAP